MCVVSMVTDHFMQRWPMQQYPYIVPSVQPGIWIDPPIQITRAQWEDYQALKRQAEEYDKRTGQPDCVKPGVPAWESAVEKVLRDRGLIE